MKLNGLVCSWKSCKRARCQCLINLLSWGRVEWIKKNQWIIVGVLRSRVCGGLKLQRLFSSPLSTAKRATRKTRRRKTIDRLSTFTNALVNLNYQLGMVDFPWMTRCGVRWMSAQRLSFTNKFKLTTLFWSIRLTLLVFSRKLWSLRPMRLTTKTGWATNLTITCLLLLDLKWIERRMCLLGLLLHLKLSRLLFWPRRSAASNTNISLLSFWQVLLKCRCLLCWVLENTC